MEDGEKKAFDVSGRELLVSFVKPEMPGVGDGALRAARECTEGARSRLQFDCGPKNAKSLRRILRFCNLTMIAAVVYKSVLWKRPHWHDHGL